MFQDLAMFIFKLISSRIPSLEPLVRFFYVRLTSLYSKSYILEKPVRFLTDRTISLQVKAVERYLPDKVLLLFMNAIDNYLPPKAIELMIEEVDKHVPNQVISSLLTTADEFVPDSVASSRKVSTVIAGVGKYIPDRVIPVESRSTWENLKIKFHIPTLLSRGRTDTQKE